jgi:membrane-associated phospholipid phosphatase
MVATSNKVKIVLVYIGIILSFLTYEIFNKINPTYPPLIMRGWLDEKIPLIPIFVFPYLSFHLLAAFLVPYISYRVAGIKAFLVNGISIIISQLCLDIAYTFFQTEVPRPKISDSSILNWILVHVIWGNDRPLNGFPSNHVTWSAISIIALWRLRKKIKKTTYLLVTWFLLIIPATVFLAQHFLIDIYGGIFVAFTVYWAVVFVIEKPDLRLIR